MKRFLAVILIVALAGCSKSPKDEITQKFERGIAELNQGKYAKADSTFRKLMADQPTDPRGLYGTGLVLERQQQSFDALGVYLKVNKANRTFSPALFGMGRVFRNIGESDLAAAAYLECTGLPDSAGAAAANFAVVRCNDRQTKSATEALTLADTSGADKTTLELIRARILAQRMQFDSADAAYAEVAKEALKSPATTQLAADFLEDRGLIDSAIRTSAGSLESKDQLDFDAVYNHFRRSLKHRYYWQARQAIARLSMGDTTSLTYLGLRTQYGLSAGELYLASQSRNRFMRKGNNSITSYIYDADVCLRIGDYSSVTQNADLAPRLAIEGTDTSAFAHYLLGMVLVRYAQAEEYAQLAADLALSTGWAADRRNYVLTYLQQFIRLGAIEPYKQSIETVTGRHGSDADWMCGLGDIWVDQLARQLDSAENYYRWALTADSTYWPAAQNFVRACINLANPKRAIGFLEKYPELVSSQPQLALDRAICLVQAGDVEQGSGAFQAALPKVKGDVTQVETMSRLLEAKGRVDLDGSLIRLLLLLDEKNPDALLLAATRDNDYGNFESAMETAERGLAIEPDNVNLQVQRARAQYGKGDKANAKLQLRTLMKGNSGSVPVNLYLSALMAGDKDSLDMIQNFARAGVFWESGSRRTINNLAFVYLQSGRPELAQGDIQSVIPQHPDWADTRFYLGVAQLAMGNKAGAKENLSRAIALGIPSGYKTKAEELLAKL